MARQTVPCESFINTGNKRQAQRGIILMIDLYFFDEKTKDYLKWLSVQNALWSERKSDNEQAIDQQYRN